MVTERKVAILGMMVVLGMIIASMPCTMQAEGAVQTYSVSGDVTDMAWNSVGLGVIASVSGSYPNHLTTLYELDGTTLTTIGEYDISTAQLKFGPDTEVLLVGQNNVGHALAIVVDITDGSEVGTMTDGALGWYSACDYNPLNNKWLIAGDHWRVVRANADLSSPSIATPSTDLTTLYWPGYPTCKYYDVTDTTMPGDIEWRPGSDTYAMISMNVFNIQRTTVPDYTNVGLLIGYRDTDMKIEGPFLGYNSIQSNIGDLTFWEENGIWIDWHSYSTPVSNWNEYLTTWPMLWVGLGDYYGLPEFWDEGWVFEHWTDGGWGAYEDMCSEHFYNHIEFDPETRELIMIGYTNRNTGTPFKSSLAVATLDDEPYLDGAYVEANYMEPFDFTVAPVLDEAYENLYTTYSAGIDLGSGQMIFGGSGTFKIDVAGFANDPPVVNLPTALSASMGVPLTLTKASIVSDPNGDATTWKITWGDGQTTDWSASATASHTYLAIDNYTITVEANDTWGGTGSDTATVVVTEVIVNPTVTILEENWPTEAVSGEDYVVTIKFQAIDAPFEFSILNPVATGLQPNDYYSMEFEYRITTLTGTEIASGNATSSVTETIDADGNYYLYLTLDTSAFEGNATCAFYVGVEGEEEVTTGTFTMTAGQGAFVLEDWMIYVIIGAVAVIVLLVVIRAWRKKKGEAPVELGVEEPALMEQPSMPVQMQEGTMTPDFGEETPLEGGQEPISFGEGGDAISVEKKGKGFVEGGNEKASARRRRF